MRINLIIVGPEWIEASEDRNCMINLQLDSLTSADLASYCGGTEVVVLAGSGISAWEPTTLPTGQDFAAGVQDALFLSPGHPPIPNEDMVFLKTLLDNLPFEMVMERCPDQDIIGLFLRDMYSGGAINEIHEALRRLVDLGHVHAIITTNYDMGLDVALAGGPLTKVVNQLDVPPGGSRVYFKIHGSIDEPGTMIFSLKQEAELPPWKRDLLATVLSGRPLLLIGYSGLDFEICPELPRCAPSKVLWNFHTITGLDRSPGVKHVRRLAVPQFALIGDMCKLFSLLGIGVSPTRAVGGLRNIGDELRGRVSGESLLMWRTRVLATIGHARLALASIQPLLRSSPDPGVAQEHAQALFHNGQYRSSAQEYLRAATTSPDIHMRLHRQLDACDSFRCFGDFRRAWTILRSVESKIRGLSSTSDDLLVRAFLKELLLIRNQWQRRKRFLGGVGCRVLKDRAKTLIERGASRALRAGLLLDLQQFGLWSERFAFPSDILSARGTYAPLPSLDGYKHLGYYIPILMKLYDALADVTVPVAEDEVQKGFDGATVMGCHPVAWKLSRGAMRRFPSDRSLWKARYKANFKACQYAISLGMGYKLAWPL
jgi:hypothetical protein